MTALIVPGEATATPQTFRARTQLLGPEALRHFAARFEAGLLALAEAGR